MPNQFMVLLSIVFGVTDGVVIGLGHPELAVPFLVVSAVGLILWSISDAT